MNDTNPIVRKLRHEVPKPVFNPTVVPVQVDEHTLHIRGGPWNGPILTLSSSGNGDVISKLVDTIDGETPIAEILGSFDENNRSEVAKVLYRLSKIDAIHDAETLEDDGLYNHHAIRPAFQEAERDHLDETTVCIVNAGRIGPHVANHLLEMGIGGVDVYRESTDVSAHPWDLEDRDRVSIVSEDEIESAVEENDFVVYTADRPYPELEATVNELTYEHRTPWVMGQIEGYDGHVGPAFFPGQTACLECFRTRIATNATNPEGLRAYRDADHGTTTDGAWITLPPFAHAVASLLSMDLLNLLLYGAGYTAGRAIWMNSVDFSFDADQVLKLPRCDVCGAEPTSGETPFMTLEDAESITEIDLDVTEE